jgi:hypothetical protein
VQNVAAQHHPHTPLQPLYDGDECDYFSFIPSSSHEPNTQHEELEDGGGVHSPPNTSITPLHVYGTLMSSETSASTLSLLSLPSHQQPQPQRLASMSVPMLVLPPRVDLARKRVEVGFGEGGWTYRPVSERTATYESFARDYGIKAVGKRCGWRVWRWRRK